MVKLTSVHIFLLQLRRAEQVALTAHEEAYNHGDFNGFSIDGKTMVAMKVVRGRLQPTTKQEHLVLVAHSEQKDRFICDIVIPDKKGKTQGAKAVEGLRKAGKYQMFCIKLQILKNCTCNFKIYIEK